MVQQWQLNQAAYAHASEMASRRYMTHTGASGTERRDAHQPNGLRWWIWGENVAAGQTTVDQVMTRGTTRQGTARTCSIGASGTWGSDGRWPSDGVAYWCLVFALGLRR